MFNFNRKEPKQALAQPVLTETPVETINTPKIVKIGSVKHLMAAALANQALNEAKLAEHKAQEEARIAMEQDALKVQEADLKKPEFIPFSPIDKITEQKNEIVSIPKHVSIWFINNLSNLMNGKAVEKSDDFYKLYNTLVEDDVLNQSPNHIGLHKIKHFIKTQMGHIFDTSKDEFITINLPALDEGIMLMGSTPDNNLVLAGNLSSLKTSDWDSIHSSLQSQVN